MGKCSTSVSFLLTASAVIFVSSEQKLGQSRHKFLWALSVLYYKMVQQFHFGLDSCNSCTVCFLKYGHVLDSLLLFRYNYNVCHKENSVASEEFVR